MHLLLTRPADEAARTAARLQALGHQVLLAPLLEFEALPLPVSFVAPTALAMTSARAIEALGPASKRPDLAKLPVFCVGAHSAAAASAAGYRDVQASEGGVEQLAALIATKLAPGKDRILYPAATERAGELDALLRRAGFWVDLVEVYRMRPADGLSRPVREALDGGSLDGILLYSRRTAETLLTLAEAAGLGEATRRVPAFAISPAVASGLGFEVVHAAAVPTEDCLIGSLSEAAGTSAAGKC